MSIYIRGDATPFVLIAQTANGKLIGRFEGDRSRFVTDLSRIVADGGANECDAAIAELPQAKPYVIGSGECLTCGVRLKSKRKAIAHECGVTS